MWELAIKEIFKIFLFTKTYLAINEYSNRCENTKVNSIIYNYKYYTRIENSNIYCRNAHKKW